MSYADTERRLRSGGIVILDGGTGTELQRRGVAMDPEAWCGPATLKNADVLERIHRDYIAAGADVVTVNTFASSRLMLGPAGFAERLEEINRTAIGAAHRAREASGRVDVLVAGSLSHMCPVVGGTARSDLARAPSEAEMADAFGELAGLLRDEGCDLILLEMMYHPERMAPAFKAATQTGLPVWAGFSARRGADGRVLGFAPERETPFEDIVQVLNDFSVQAAGIMHNPANVIGDAIAILRGAFTGPLMAYPDSGYFEMPHWRFEDVIPPDELMRFAAKWVEGGVQIVGGCCGLSPDHIAALGPLKDRPSP
jgi:homocysteine S-methyltransferase